MLLFKRKKKINDDFIPEYVELFNGKFSFRECIFEHIELDNAMLVFEWARESNQLIIRKKVRKNSNSVDL